MDCTKTGNSIPKLAIIVPCFNEEALIASTTKELLTVLSNLIDKKKIAKDSYIYFIDDGSKDLTWKNIELENDKNKQVKGLKFIRNYGNQKALLAGLLGAQNIGCDCVISIDADLQQDTSAIEKFIDEYSKGAEIVCGIRNNRNTDSFFKKYTALMFYKLMNILGVKIPVNHSDFRLVSSKALRILDKYSEKQLFLRGFFNELGLETSCVYFNVKPRTIGKSKFNPLNLLTLALNGITSYSIVPLRIIAVFGFIMMLIGFGVGVNAMVQKFILNVVPNGWATLVVLLSIFGGLQLLCLGIIGEYLGQIFREVKARPRYIADVELK